MEKEITVIKVEIVKEGNTNGKDWVIRKVFCNGDDDMKEFTTFEDRYANSDGQRFKDNFVYDEKYKNWKTQSVAQAKTNEKHDEIMEGLRKVWDKVDELERAINKLGVPRTEDKLKEGELEIPIIDEPIK